jgi:hypothetical protein
MRERTIFEGTAPHCHQRQTERPVEAMMVRALSPPLMSVILPWLLKVPRACEISFSVRDFSFGRGSL